MKKNTTRYKSNLQEKSVAKDLKGRKQINSGAFWSMPGDVRTDHLLIECKTTEKDYYSLTLKTWEKVRTEAIRDGLRIPVMCIDLNDGKDRIAVFEEKAFEVVDFETVCTMSKSIRITPVRGMLRQRIVFGTSLNPETYKVLQCVLWSDFINLIKGE